MSVITGNAFKDDNPMMAAERGEFFVPQEREWVSDKLVAMSLIADAIIVAGFLVTVLILSL